MSLKHISVFIVFNIFLISCRKEVNDGLIIFTIVPGNALSDPTSVASKIVALDPEEPGKQLKVLTGDFFYASHPQISYDGKSMLFEGRKNGSDPVQIWKMDLKNSKITRITGSKQNCTGAVWLPGDKIVFNSESGINSQRALFTCKADGSGISRITFDPYIYSSLSVLKDGRITALRNETGCGEHAKLMVLRPDGTKAQIFCLSPDSSYKTGPMHENADGIIYFIEKTIKGNGDIISIRYNNPFNSRNNLTGDSGINFLDVVPLKTSKLLVTFKKSGNNKYSLGIFDPESREIVKTFYEDQNNQLAEAVVAQSQERPKKLPSEVDPGVKTGLLLCQDINCNFTFHKPSVSMIRKANRIEIVGIDSILGVVKTKNDGSVYLKVVADTPFHIKTYDEKGNLVQGTSDWIYLRPNERRGCVGCHEDPALVPENKLSQAVAGQPVNIPVHIRSIKEKEILLE